MTLMNDAWRTDFPAKWTVVSVRKYRKNSQTSRPSPGRMPKADPTKKSRNPPECGAFSGLV